jgi:hypothetical protein
MIPPGLTKPLPTARSLRMQVIGQGQRVRRARGAVVLMGMAAMLSACISVTAPDKPIVIELNINIKQDVVYSLAPDAKNTIESNPGGVF